MHIVMSIVNYFLWFIAYSVIGWIIETVLFAVRDKKSVKRGFLFGPLCPIYGTGAVICTLVLYGRITNFFALFAAGLVLCDTIEYITHFVLEKVFHSKWWDYSNQKFNIKGRICLTSSLLFGGGVAVLLRFIQPAVERWTEMIPAEGRAITAFIIYSILIVDVTITVQSMKNIVRKLKEVQQYIIDNVQEGIDKTDEKVDELVDHFKTIPSSDVQYEHIKEKIKSNEHIQKIVDTMKNEDPQVRKIRGLAPRLQLGKYKDALELIFNRQDSEKKSEHNKKDDDEKKQ